MLKSHPFIYISLTKISAQSVTWQFLVTGIIIREHHLPTLVLTLQISSLRGKNDCFTSRWIPRPLLISSWSIWIRRKRLIPWVVTGDLHHTRHSRLLFSSHWVYTLKTWSIDMEYARIWNCFDERNMMTIVHHAFRVLGNTPYILSLFCTDEKFSSRGGF